MHRSNMERANEPVTSEDGASSATTAARKIVLYRGRGRDEHAPQISSGLLPDPRLQYVVLLHTAVHPTVEGLLGLPGGLRSSRKTHRRH